MPKLRYCPKRNINNETILCPYKNYVLLIYLKPTRLNSVLRNYKYLFHFNIQGGHKLLLDTFWAKIGNQP